MQLHLFVRIVEHSIYFVVILFLNISSQNFARAQVQSSLNNELPLVSNSSSVNEFEWKNSEHTSHVKFNIEMGLQTGGLIQYQYRLTDRLLIGLAYGEGGLSDKSTFDGEGGLDAGKHFELNKKYKYKEISLGSSFYIRNSGFVDWGPLLSLNFGQQMG